MKYNFGSIKYNFNCINQCKIYFDYINQYKIKFRQYINQYNLYACILFAVTLNVSHCSLGNLPYTYVTIYDYLSIRLPKMIAQQFIYRCAEH